MIPAGEAARRAAVVAGALVLWFGTQRLLGARPALPPAERGDLLHRGTAALHRRLEADPRRADRLLAASSAGIDLLGLGVVAAAVLGPTFRPFLALLGAFALRQACQFLVVLPPPPGMIWRSPGVPTLLVTYGVAGDFFFSGHTAIAVLGALEAAAAGPPWLAIAAGILAAAEAATVIVLRAHWTVDVVAGAAAAWGCHALASLAAPAVDAWIRGAA